MFPTLICSIALSLILGLIVLALLFRKQTPRQVAELRCYGGPLDGAELHIRADQEGQYMLLEYRGHIYESFETPDRSQPFTMRHAGKLCR